MCGAGRGWLIRSRTAVNYSRLISAPVASTSTQTRVSAPAVSLSFRACAEFPPRFVQTPSFDVLFVPKSSVICPGCRVAKPPLCHRCHQWLSSSASFRLSFVDSVAPAHVACGGLRPSAPSARALRCSLSSVKRIRGVVSRIASAAAQGLRCMLWILLPSATSLPFPSSLHQPC